MAIVSSPEIRETRAELGLSQELFSRALDVSARSVERWEARTSVNLDADTWRRLTAIREVLALAAEVYAGQAATFLATPRRSLSMRTPREAMIRGDIEAVREILVDELQGNWA